MSEFNLFKRLTKIYESIILKIFFVRLKSTRKEHFVKRLLSIFIEELN